MKNKPFNIVNASAGSGKTYRLVKEYILLLIDTENNRSFSNIIAMTFTNKAAVEMKERIVSSLDKISSPLFFDNELMHLTQELSNELNCKNEQIQQRCQKVLLNILHQYEDFNVMTIDKFNLRLIRSFGRELDLVHDFDVIMDTEEVLEKIVDDLLNQLGQSDHVKLNELVLKYAESKIDEGNSWNIRKKLVEFGKILTTEKNTKKVEILLKMNFSMDQYKALILQKKEIDATFLKRVNHFISLFESGEIDVNSLPGKSAVPKRFTTIKKQNNYYLPNKKSPLFSDTFFQKIDHEKFPLQLRDEILAFYEYWKKNLQEYVRIKLFLANFFNMALLQFMANALQKIKKEDQMILISEFSSLIAELIQKESTPYVYERLGTRFQHFLLDEFQDTSHMQWLNIVPLIHDSLSNNKKNLIVGDAKQSIYRFKNGLAEQFIELPKIYNPEKNTQLTQVSNYFNEMGNMEELEFNFRSSPTIVQFNNSFFEDLKKTMSDKTASYYKSIYQTPRSESNGLVTIISKEYKTDDEQIVGQMIEWIEECKSDGFDYGDICILGNKNKSCNQWAILLTEKGYTVVSTESLLIDSDKMVQLTINYLYWRLRYSDNDKKKFIELFLKLKNKDFTVYQSYFKASENGYRYFDDEQFIRDFFATKNKFLFHYESIYDLIQGFYRIMNLNELENPYLHHLADICFDFELKKGPNLRLFLEHYERTKKKIAVQIPESKDALQIMTVHKSKGLEFPVVILPTINYNLDVKESFLVDAKGFMIYKKPTTNELLQELVDEFEEEEEQVRTDSTNICYVAMTRPVERLYVQNYFDKSKFGSVFHEILSTQKDISQREDELSLNIGSRKRTSEENRKKKSKLYHPKNISDKLWFPDISLRDHEELDSEDYLSNEMQFGIQFHLLASKIDHISSIEEIIEKYIQEGEVDQVNAKELTIKLNELMNSTEYSALFDHKNEVLNEQSFIVNSTKSIRPDKVILKNDATIIIDYKTGIPEGKDIKQITEYQSILREMNYPNIKCYLYYSSLGELRLVG